MTEFKKYLQSKNINPTSIQKYIVQVEKFKTYLAKDLDSVEKKDILNYLQFLQENKNLSNRTRQQTLGILRHYYNHIQIPNPTNLLNIRGTRKKILYKTLSIEELNDFIDIYYNANRDNLRNNIILSLLVYQGLKLSEWKAIKVNDIDLIKGTIFIAETRKSNQRKLLLQANQLGLLYAYMREKNESDILLFTSTPELQKWATKLRKLYPKFTDFKQIRTSIITYWIQTEGLRKAQYKAGHRYISSTENYLSNDLESLKDDISQFHPL
ncbi:MAG: tyrosine-type recombinase/integrase [Chitinophagales bacterium]|jgi:site-specific recombinase XerD